MSIMDPEERIRESQHCLEKLSGFSTDTKQKLSQLQERLIASSSRGDCILQGGTEIIVRTFDIHSRD